MSNAPNRPDGALSLPPAKQATFNDPIHGTLQLHWLLGKMISTPEFHRLHHIKQLSSTFYVYPEASHTRYSHSIGTAHLAGKLVKHLRRGQSDLGILEEDVLCVQIAGLCHDLGHGPYSHLFDDRFLPLIGRHDWKHEECSCRMFDKMVERLKTKEVGERPGQSHPISEFLNEDRCNFIKEMINPSHQGGYEGLNDKKHFFFQIISNKTSGVDVDKWDYFARDCYHLGITNSFLHERYIKFTRVISVPQDEGKQHICAMKKEAFNLYGMFRARFSLHKNACQHKRKNALDHMISDALFAAYEDLEVAGVKGIHNCIEKGQEEAFCHLDDRILLKIEQSRDNGSSGINKAREILKRVADGDHYRIIGETAFRPQEHFNDKKDIREKENQVADRLEKIDRLLRGNIRVSIATFNYGMGNKDPINQVWFYDRDDKDKAFHVKKDDVSRLLPSVFEEYMLQVFCTDSALTVRAKTTFDEWKKSAMETCIMADE